MRKVYGSILAALGIIGSIATLVSLAKHGLNIEFHSIPKEIFHYYELFRDRIFNLIEEILFEWWLDLTINQIVRDLISFYLFFGLSLERSRSDDVTAFIFKYILRGGTLRTEGPGFGFSLTRILTTVLLWPYGFWKTIRGWQDYRKQKVSSRIPEEAQRQATKMQIKIMWAGFLSYPITLIIAFFGVLAFLFWNLIEGQEFVSN